MRKQESSKNQESLAAKLVRMDPKSSVPYTKFCFNFVWELGKECGGYNYRNNHDSYTGAHLFVGCSCCVPLAAAACVAATPFTLLADAMVKGGCFKQPPGFPVEASEKGPQAQQMQDSVQYRSLNG